MSDAVKEVLRSLQVTHVLIICCAEQIDVR
jgi:hypothetical protein